MYRMVTRFHFFFFFEFFAAGSVGRRMQFENYRIYNSHIVKNVRVIFRFFFFFRSDRTGYADFSCFYFFFLNNNFFFPCVYDYPPPETSVWFTSGGGTSAGTFLVSSVDILTIGENQLVSLNSNCPFCCESVKTIE